MISKKIFLVLFIVIISMFLITYAITSELRAGIAEITGINVKKVNDNTEIQIDSDAPLLSYTIYRPDDPYKVAVELQDVELGRFQEKMVIDKAGVTEIIPTKIDNDSKAVKLDIILTVPADIKPVQKGNTLVLTFYNPDEDQPGGIQQQETALKEQEEPGIFAETEETGAMGFIEDIEMVRSAGKLHFLVHGNTNMSPKVFEVGSSKLVVDIPDVMSKVETIDEFDLPVLGVRIGEQTDKTRLVFDLLESTEYDVSSGDNEVTVSFKSPEMQMARAVTSARQRTTPYASEREVPLQTRSMSEPFYTNKYVGEKITLDFQDADLLHIIRLLADVSGYNIVTSPQVGGKFSMKLVDVPWDQALDIILRNYGLSKTLEGNIIRIAPNDVIAQEEEAIAKAKEAKLKSGDLITRMYKISYADVNNVQESVKGLITERGTITLDGRTSTMIIKDVDSTHAEIQRLIISLDLPTPQVNIESKIVEVSTNFTKELGVQWGMLWSPPDSRTTIGGPSIPGGAGFNSENPFLVNLPASVGPGTGGAIGIGYISASQVFSLDLQLSAMELSGQGKIISHPRITTMDNQEAVITQGKKIPYQGEAESGGTTTEFADAELELTVTPHITPDNTIMMDVEVKKNEADFSNAVNNVPAIDTKEASTKVLIRNGDTLVIGGVYKTTVSTNVTGVPGFSKIPILGWLFKSREDIENRDELLIFITPRIVENL
jgi:type IV pilus assembly protein PilQ